MQSQYMDSLPVYMQIMQQLRQNIISGHWPPGMRVPPVRELSLHFGVNPNTAQRSLAELEHEQLVFTESTTGRFITTDAERITNLRKQMAEGHAQHFYSEMQALGFTKEEMIDCLSSIVEQSKKDSDISETNETEIQQ